MGLGMEPWESGTASGGTVLEPEGVPRRLGGLPGGGGAVAPRPRGRRDPEVPCPLGPDEHAEWASCTAVCVSKHPSRSHSKWGDATEFASLTRPSLKKTETTKRLKYRRQRPGARDGRTDGQTVVMHVAPASPGCVCVWAQRVVPSNFSPDPRHLVRCHVTPRDQGALRFGGRRSEATVRGAPPLWLGHPGAVLGELRRPRVLPGA